EGGTVDAPAPSAADTDEYDIDAVAGQHDGEAALGLTEEPDARHGYVGEHGYGAEAAATDGAGGPSTDEPVGGVPDGGGPAAAPEGLVEDVPAGLAGGQTVGEASSENDIVDEVPTFDAEATQVHADDEDAFRTPA